MMTTRSFPSAAAFTSMKQPATQRRCLRIDQPNQNMKIISKLLLSTFTLGSLSLLAMAEDALGKANMGKPEDRLTSDVQFRTARELLVR